MDRSSRRIVLAVIILVGLPYVAHAQSAIAGVVRDASDAVLPGVTVEAASSALIEKVRSTASDGSGQYEIVDLRPGTYVLTFTLTGLQTIRREGIQLAAEVTASVDAEMKVGEMQETITVTADASPVDVRSAVVITRLDRDVLDNIPTGLVHVGIEVGLHRAVRLGRSATRPAARRPIAREAA